MGLFDLSGKVAIVTGSTRGIGLAIARMFQDHGARVMISSEDPADCERAGYRLKTLAIPADVGSTRRISGV